MHTARVRWNSQTWTCNSLLSSGFKLALILVYYNVLVQVIVLDGRKAKRSKFFHIKLRKPFLYGLNLSGHTIMVNSSCHEFKCE